MAEDVSASADTVTAQYRRSQGLRKGRDSPAREVCEHDY